MNSEKIQSLEVSFRAFCYLHSGEKLGMRIGFIAYPQNDDRHPYLDMKNGAELIA
jgi:hypothetical protein